MKTTIRNAILYNERCETVLPRLHADSVDLLVTDPPYTVAALKALPSWCELWQRVLKPSASLYVFASAKRAIAVERIIAEHFNVLNVIRWVKSAGWHKKVDRKPLRQYLQPWEAIIFAEQKESTIRGVRGEIIGGYIRSKIEASDASPTDVRRLFPTSRGNKTNLLSCWYGGLSAPSAEQYAKLQKLLKPHLAKPYAELMAEAGNGTRTFNATDAEIPGDVWEFDPVHPKHRLHKSQKPLALVEQIVKVSSNSSDRVLDPFMGSGTTAVAAVEHGRAFVGMEPDAGCFKIVGTRLRSK